MALSQRKKWLLACGSLLAALALGEVGLRLFLRLKGEPYDASHYLSELVRIETSLVADRPMLDLAPHLRETDPERHGEIAHPYSGVDAAYLIGSFEATVAWLRGRASKSEIDVVVIGGSVAANFGNLGFERLAELCTADPRWTLGPLRVHNLARGGYHQPQQLNVLTFLLANGGVPDAVLLIDGFNEVAIAAQNAAEGGHPLYPMIARWALLTSSQAGDRRALDLILELRKSQTAASAIRGRAETPGWLRSALLGRWSLLSMRRVNLEASRTYLALSERRREILAHGPQLGPQFRGDLRTAVSRSILAWSECSRMIAELCRGRGIPFVHVLQPTLHDPGSKPATAKELETSKAPEEWLEAVLVGYPILRERSADLAAAGVDFLDASRVFAEVEGELYYDSCHFDLEGNRLLAEFIAPRFIEAATRAP